MHRYNYINAAPLLNIKQKLEYFIRYAILKISKLSTILSVRQQASQPACHKTSSTSAMAPDSSYKKGNHI